MTHSRSVLGVALLLVAAVAWQAGGQAVPFRPGQPLAGITPHDFERFLVGLDDFLEVETAEEGLGPAYNGTSCAVCHSVPAIGGVGLVAEVRAGFREASGEFRPLIGQGDTGETLVHLFSTPGHACQPSLPPGVNVVARRIPIPLFGAGLVEAIPDEVIEAMADPDDRNRDGVRGRAAVVLDLASGQRRIGRFGWKAQHATLIAFSADAYRNEMGITNELIRDELAIGIPADRMRLCDPIPDPEDVRDPRTGRSALDNFEAFMKFLAPLPRRTVNEQTREGERVFASIGCAACHVPSLRTGSSANPLFHQQMVPLFSDLLLHDVGTGDGIAQGPARPNEIRTPALWGLGARGLLLHDGSASTIEEAIERHAEEAATARSGFRRLDAASRQALLAFLNGL
ncbi:MAG: di-heme oxidoredictase family protein [Acidobacteriota bacterium]